MNYKQYLKESPDRVLDTNGKYHIYYEDINNIPFYYVNGYYVCLVSLHSKGTELFIVKNNKIILDIIGTKFIESELRHGHIDDFFFLYTIHVLRQSHDVITDIDEYIVNTLDIAEQTIENIRKNIKDDYESSGRVFPIPKFVSIRKCVNKNKIKKCHNIIAQKLHRNLIDNSWFFERPVDDGTSSLPVDEDGFVITTFGNSNKKVNMTSTLKLPNPVPNLVLNRDWSNAKRTLGIGWAHNVSLAKKQMNDEQFDNYIKKQLPLIKRASLRIGENNEL